MGLSCSAAFGNAAMPRFHHHHAISIKTQKHAPAIRATAQWFLNNTRYFDIVVIVKSESVDLCYRRFLLFLTAKGRYCVWRLILLLMRWLAELFSCFAFDFRMTHYYVASRTAPCPRPQHKRDATGRQKARHHAWRTRHMPSHSRSLLFAKISLRISSYGQPLLTLHIQF